MTGKRDHSERNEFALPPTFPGWLTFACLVFVTASGLSWILLKWWWFPAVLLLPGTSFALGWTALVMLARQRTEIADSTWFLIRLWLISLGRALAIGLMLVYLALLAVIGSTLAFLILVGLVESVRLSPLRSDFAGPFTDEIVGSAISVFPLLVCGLFLWKRLWPLLQLWWWDDLRDDLPKLFGSTQSIKKL